MTGEAQIQPFLIDLPQADLDDLYARLTATRSPDGHVNELIAYWCCEYDWRAWEDRLNSFPQFVTEIAGEQVHFLHVRSAMPSATALLLAPEWPGMVVEHLDLIEAFTSAFHLVIPTMPGTGFSGPIRGCTWDSRRATGAWAELLGRLGYGHSARIAPLRGTKAPSPGYPVAESPAGLLAWVAQGFAESADRELIITVATIYFLTDPIWGKS